MKCFMVGKVHLRVKGLKVNLMKTMVMVSNIGQVTVRPCGKKDPCGICGRITMLSTVLCKSCATWMMCID